MGANHQWFNTLPSNSIDSWEEARAAFIQHFANAYTRASTIEDLYRCIQGPRESTRRWVQRWQDMWTTCSGISTDTAIYYFLR
jgi:carotenoid cleavage dioxygenase-like enzyme